MNIESNAQPTFSSSVEAIDNLLAAEEQEPVGIKPEDEASESADDAEDMDEAESESEESEDAAPVAKTFKVKIDGEEVEVPEDELLKGYSRTQDYTRKTQALADQRKQIDAEFEAVRGERAQYAQLLNQLDAKLNEPPIFDESLQYTDPIAYAQQLANYVQWERQKNAIQEERQRLDSVQQEEQKAYMQRYLSEQQERLNILVPDWVDKEVAKAEQAKIRSVAKEYGYKDEELNQVFDARAVAMMRDAMRYRELVAKRQEIKPKASPVVNSRPANRSSEVAQAKQRLAKTGNVKDAAALISKML